VAAEAEAAAGHTVVSKHDARAWHEHAAASPATHLLQRLRDAAGAGTVRQLTAQQAAFRHDAASVTQRATSSTAATSLAGLNNGTAATTKQMTSMAPTTAGSARLGHSMFAAPATHC
jgi:hypothetical protein